MHFGKISKMVVRTVTCAMLTVGLVLTGQPGQMLLNSGIVEAQASTVKFRYTLSDEEVYVFEIKEDDTLSLIGWEGTATDITIPSSVMGKPLTSIRKAFYECETINSVVIPEGVKSIELNAFSDCINLTSVTLPESLTSIGGSAFYNCISLKSITIPEGVTSIYGFAFYNCRSLTSVVIPDGVTSIDDETFAFCTNLTSVTIPKSVTRIGAVAFGWCSSLTDVTIPDGVTVIEYGTFYECSSLDSIMIPEGVTTIESDAFGGNSNLKSVTIPENVTELGYEVFTYCTSLTDISVSDNNEYYKVIDGILYTKDGSELIVCPAGKKGEIVIPEGVETIGSWGFAGCSGLTSVTLPKSVTMIDCYAFENCSNLSNVTMFKGMVGIERDAFINCDNLKQLYIPVSVKYIEEHAIGYSYENYISGYERVSEFTIVGIPESKAEEHAIRNGFTFVDSGEDEIVEKITKITIPSELTFTVGDSYKLEVESDSNELVPQFTFESDHESIVSIDENGNMVALKTGTACITVTSVLDPSVMAYCDVTVNYAEKTYTVGNSTFSYVNDTNKYITITDWEGTDTEIIIPESIDGVVVKGIEAGALDKATEVTSITIPSGVTSIAKGVFDNCDKLEKILVAEGNSRFKSVDGVLINANKFEQVDLSNESGITNEQEVSELIAPQAGTYYLGTNLNNNYIYKIQVTEENGNIYTFEADTLEAAEKGTYANGDIVSAGDSNFFEIIMSTSSKVDSSSKTWEDGKKRYQRVNFGGQADILTPKNVVRFTVSDKATVKVWWVKGEAMRQIGLYRESVSIVKCPNNMSGEYVIPNDVTSIGNDSFKNCDKLTSVIVPQSVTYIGEYALGYDYDEVNGKYELKNNFVIYGTPNSVAGNYASENGITFEEHEEEEKLQGLNKAEDGKWYYYADGVVDTSYTGLADNTSGKWYVQSGSVTMKATGLYKVDGVWYYLQGSKVQKNYTGIATNGSGKWYVENGIVTLKYNGSVEIDGVTYTVVNSKVTETTSINTTELKKVDGVWGYYVNGTLDTSYTGLAKNSAGTWYVEEGTVSLTYNGTIESEGVTYTIENSKVTGSTTITTATTGLQKVEGIWGYYVDGTLDTGYTGFAENASGTWYVQNGIVTLKASGLYKINSGWYYLSGSKLRSDYTGLATNNAGEWYVENGVVSLEYNGTVTIDGVEYTVVGSKVQ